MTRYGDGECVDLDGKPTDPDGDTEDTDLGDGGIVNIDADLRMKDMSVGEKYFPPRFEDPEDAS